MVWFTGIMGVALIVAPFLMGYTDNVLALWTSIITGLIVLAVAVFKGIKHDEARWEYMVAAVVGLLAVFAPFALGFSGVTMAVWSLVILGGILAFFDGFQGFFAKPQSK